MSGNLHRTEPDPQGPGKMIVPLPGSSKASATAPAVHPYLLFYETYLEAERQKTELLKLHFKKHNDAGTELSTAMPEA